MKLNLRLSLSTRQYQNSCSETPPVYQDLSTGRGLPVKKFIVEMDNQVGGKFEIHFQ